MLSAEEYIYLFIKVIRVLCLEESSFAISGVSSGFTGSISNRMFTEPTYSSMHFQRGAEALNQIYHYVRNDFLKFILLKTCQYGTFHFIENSILKLIIRLKLSKINIVMIIQPKSLSIQGLLILQDEFTTTIDKVFDIYLVVSEYIPAVS